MCQSTHDHESQAELLSLVPMLLVAVVAYRYGCIDSITLPVQVYCNPEADFSTENECKDNPIQVNNLSNVGDAPFLMHYWDFNTNNIDNLVSPQFSTDFSPVVTFSGSGSFIFKFSFCFNLPNAPCF